MNEKNKIFIIIGIVLFVLITAFGIWYYLTNRSSIFLNSPINQPHNSSTPLQTPQSLGTATSSTQTKNPATTIPSFNIQFQGHAAKGQYFKKVLGNGLVFHLIPDNYGWNIEILPEHDQENVPYGGFASIATPPFHGINALQIQGWHWRNIDNTAANDGSVNAPQEIRDFEFVVNNADAQKMGAAIEQFTSGKTLSFSPYVSLGQGKLVIKNLKLGNLIEGKQAWIESMDFKVTLQFNSASAAQTGGNTHSIY